MQKAKRIVVKIGSTLNTSTVIGDEGRANLDDDAFGLLHGQRQKNIETPAPARLLAAFLPGRRTSAEVTMLVATA